MKRTKKLLSLFGLILVTASLTGCWESHEVTFHQPGVYYGPPDTLSSDSVALETRFQRQMDR